MGGPFAIPEAVAALQLGAIPTISNETLVSILPEAYRTKAIGMLQRLEEKGANVKQKRDFVETLKIATDHLKEQKRIDIVVDFLDAVSKRENFTPQMLGPIKVACEMEKENIDYVLPMVYFAIKNPNVKPEEVTEEFTKNIVKLFRFMNEGIHPVDGQFSINSYHVLSGLMRNQNFDPRNVDMQFMKSFRKMCVFFLIKARGDAEKVDLEQLKKTQTEISYALHKLFSNPHYQMNMLWTVADMSNKTKFPEHFVKSIDSFNEILDNPIGTRLVELAKLAINKVEGFYLDLTLSALNRLFQNPNIDERLLDSVEAIIKNQERPDFCLNLINSILEKKDDKAIDNINWIVSNAGQDILFPLRVFLAATENPNISIDQNFLRNAVESGKRIRSAQMGDTYLNDMAIDCFVSLVKNKNFSSSDLTPEITRRISEIILLAKSKLQLQTPLEEGGNVVLFDRVVPALFSNPNLRKDMVTNNIADRLSDALNYIDAHAHSRVSTSQHLAASLSNPNFDISIFCSSTGKEALEFVGRVVKIQNSDSSKLIGSDGRWSRQGESMIIELSRSKSIDPMKLITIENYRNLAYFFDVIKPEDSGESSEFIEFQINDALKSFLKNERLTLDVIDPKIAQRIRSMVLSVAKKAGKDKKKALADLNIILNSKDFNPINLGSLELLVKESNKDDISELLKSTSGMLSVGIDEMKLAFNNIAFNYENTKKWMAEKGIKEQDIRRVINFSYALQVIGEKKTYDLYKRSNVEYFGRYTKPVLEEAHKCLDPGYRKGEPVLFAAFAKSDWNGAFYRSGEKSLSGLLKYYRISLVETGNEKEFYDFVRSTGETYGKIELSVVGGHGTESSVELGGKDEEESSLDLLDRTDLQNLKSYFVEKPTFVFNSCSTGKRTDGIAALFSDVFNAAFFAPVYPSAGFRYTLDGDGKLLNVEYTVVSATEISLGKKKK
ncbi:MAG TPA: hypothetical protein VI912_02435 [Candidatus Bilamarchaeaceae archaeon]|nr:hypothetical protein [Candidatus Bilamarchaeaceae archaeon]